jgi:hypothetical protein
MKKSILFPLLICFCSLAFANNMLVQNVTTTGNNATNQTIQVQFDISWDNSWRDSINWDAAWIFIKFKDANGLWQHAKLNQTGFTNGSGTANTLQVTSDKVGSWLYRSAPGSGTFNTTGMQLQWNYGLSGLSNVTGLEVRVFAVEMVYVPEGDFNCQNNFYGYNGLPSLSAPGANDPVINSRMTPTLDFADYSQTIQLRIKGNTGIDTDNDGIVDNTNYPTGYFPFYTMKYELSEQQYADFLNTLTESQVTLLGVAGANISLVDSQYFSSTPNSPCNNANDSRFFSLSDWYGLRPISYLEINKIIYGPYQPIGYTVFPVPIFFPPPPSAFGQDVSFYGVSDFALNLYEPAVKLNSFNFNSTNGNGQLLQTGESDVPSWSNGSVIFIDGLVDASRVGFRYVRSAE